MVEQKRPGRRGRGARTSINARIPDDQYAIYDAAALKLGIPIGSYITMRLAENHGLPVPEYVLDEIETARVRREQELHQNGAQPFDLPIDDEGGVPLARSA